MIRLLLLLSFLHNIIAVSNFQPHLVSIGLTNNSKGVDNSFRTESSNSNNLQPDDQSFSDINVNATVNDIPNDLLFSGDSHNGESMADLNITVTKNFTSPRAEDEQFWSTFDADNSDAMDFISYLGQLEEGWQVVCENEGVSVEKRFLNVRSFVRKVDADKGSKHACIRSVGVIDANPERVFDMFADSERVPEYNKLCLSVEDIIMLPKIEYPDHEENDKIASNDEDQSMLRKLKVQWSKISYAITPSYAPFQSRDFLSVVHFAKFSNGTSVVLNRPAYVSSHAPTSSHVRATILVGGNIIRPFGEHANQTHLTMIAQVNPGGGADTPSSAWLLNQLSARGPLIFMKSLEAAARHSTPVEEILLDSSLSHIPAESLATDVMVSDPATEVPSVPIKEPDRRLLFVPASKLLHLRNFNFARRMSILSPLESAVKILQRRATQVAAGLSTVKEDIKSNTENSRVFQDMRKSVHATRQRLSEQTQCLADRLQTQRPLVKATCHAYGERLGTQLCTARARSKTLSEMLMNRMKVEMNSRFATPPRTSPAPIR